MAKTRVRYAEAPPRRDVYFGMLVMINLAMLMGIIALALECNEYEWDSEPKSGPAISLPKLTVPAPKDTTGTPAGGDPMNQPPAPGPGLGMVDPAPADPIPSRLPAIPLDPPVIAVAPEVAPMPSKSVPLARPVVDEGPRPGFNPYLR